jgi:hypothetical protein
VMISGCSFSTHIIIKIRVTRFEVMRSWVVNEGLLINPRSSQQYMYEGRTSPRKEDLTKQWVINHKQSMWIRIMKSWTNHFKLMELILLNSLQEQRVQASG